MTDEDTFTIVRTSVRRAGGRRVVDNELEWRGVRRLRPDETQPMWWRYPETGRRLRGHLAAAPDDVYAAGIAEHRGHYSQKVLSAYLAPTREDWVDELCADPRSREPDRIGDRWMVFCALGGREQLAGLGQPLYGHDLDVHATLIDGVGHDPVVPLLMEALDASGRTPNERVLLDVLAALPRDDAFRALLERVRRPVAAAALAAAARRFPSRALRLLPESRAPEAAELLSARVRAHRDRTEALLPGLPAGPRRAVERALDANPRLPDAADLPPLLTEPPWTRPGTKAGPVVLEDLPMPAVREPAWEPGERQEWASRTPHPPRRTERADFEKLAANFKENAPDVQFMLIEHGPADLVRPLLRGWRPADRRRLDDRMRAIVARFELDAHDAALSAARRRPDVAGAALLPLRSDEIARTMADWLVRLKAARRTARAWFARHGAAAAPALVPDALGKAGASRRAAETALRLISGRHGPEPVVEAARAHGDEAAAAIEALLAADPLDDHPAEIPAPGWTDIRALPQILLRDRTRALPDESVRHVLTMLAMSTPDAPYAGVRTVREICDPASLAEFGWALFRQWIVRGSPSREGWALAQLALTGDDETVRRLAPVIRAWPGEGAHTKAVAGLDVLAAIGTGTALVHLHGISQRVKYKGLRAKAQERIAEVAAELELTSEQLADRLVPDFGLDASGTLVLDYGPRRFTIGFDELLRPTITGDGGKIRKSLPKPGANDDPDLAPAAYKRFADLKKDVRTVAPDQLSRLEQAMVERRRRPVAEFRDLLVAHPLLGRLVRRLVWRTDDTGFRVAEDGTFADVHDETITLPESARVGIAHPLDLPGTLQAWSQVFADYEILQPFPQLGRPVHALTADERETGRLTRFEGAKAGTGDVLGLVRRGWERGEPQDAGIEFWISRRLGPDRYLVVALDPGIVVGEPDLLDVDQTLEDVRLAARPDRYWAGERTGLRLGDLDPVTASEALADLTHLT